MLISHFRFLTADFLHVKMLKIHIGLKDMSLGLSFGLLFMKLCWLQDTNFCSRDSPQSLYPLSETYYKELEQSSNLSCCCVRMNTGQIYQIQVYRKCTWLLTRKISSLHNLSMEERVFKGRQKTKEKLGEQEAGGFTDL